MFSGTWLSCRQTEEEKRQQTLSRRTCSAWACAHGIGNGSDMKPGVQEAAQICCSHISCVCLCISATASEILSPNCHHTTHRKLGSHMLLSADMHSNCSDVEMNFYQCTRSSAVLCVNSSANVLSPKDKAEFIRYHSVWIAYVSERSRIILLDLKTKTPPGNIIIIYKLKLNKSERDSLVPESVIWCSNKSVVKKLYRDCAHLQNV